MQPPRENVRVRYDRDARSPCNALFVLLKHHLLPHAALVEAGNVEALVCEIKDADISALVMLCENDDKVLRYLKLFCMLVA